MLVLVTGCNPNAQPPVNHNSAENPNQQPALASNTPSNWETIDLSALDGDFVAALIIVNWNTKNAGTYSLEVRDSPSVTANLLWDPKPVEGDSKTRTKFIGALPATKKISLRVTPTNALAVQPYRKDDEAYAKPGIFSSVVLFRGPEIVRVADYIDDRGVFTTPIGVTVVFIPRDTLKERR